MSSTKENFGLKFWSDVTAGGPAPSVDIVAVQGLGADPYWTWVKKVPSAAVHNPKGTSRTAFRVPFFSKRKLPIDRNESDNITEVMWIRDLLVPVLKDARIATYSYKSDWTDRTIKTSLRQCAEQFLNILLQNRQQEEEQKRPLLLIGHSLGCLVIQQALVMAIHQQEFTALRLSVSGIIFLGAPFQGSDIARVGTGLAQILGLDATILKMLQKDSPLLHALATDFWGSYSNYDTTCFYETLDANYGPFIVQVVSPQSSSFPGKRRVPLDANHSGLNKFSGNNDQNFKLVLSEIRKMVKNGGSVVTERHRANDTGAASSGKKHWRVPRSVNNLFTGRTELLLRIQTALRSDHNLPEKQKRFVITGLGGLGKSEICLQVANLMRDEYILTTYPGIYLHYPANGNSFVGIFWVNVDEPDAAERDFIAIAKDLGNSVETAAEAVQVLANHPKSWLLILDNADNQNFDYHCYFPPGNHGVVLMTSRVAECRKYSPDAFEELKGLEEEDSKELLLKAAEFRRESWPSHEAEAMEVVRLLGSHTLALVQAGAYISQGRCQLHQYPEVYKRQRQRLLNYEPNQINSRYFSVYATFEASADALQRSLQSGREPAGDALRLLEIMSMLASSVFPLQIFEAAWEGCKEISTDDIFDVGEASLGEFSQLHVSQLPSLMVPEGDEWDSFRLTDAASLLISLSLITRHDLDGQLGLSMHPLTHAWAKDRQDTESRGRAWITAGCVLGFSRTNNELWRTQERLLLPHILSYLDIKVSKAFKLGSKAVIVPIFVRCGWVLVAMRLDSKLDELLQSLFPNLKLNPTKPLEDHLGLYDLQSRNLLNLRRDKEAILLLKQVVKIRENMLPETHPDRLASQHELASAYESNGQFDKATELIEHVVKIRENTLPETNLDLLASQHELVVIYNSNGQVDKAIELLEHIVKIQQNTLPETHPNRLASQHVLAFSYESNGQVDKAIELLEHVVKIEENRLPETHPSRLASQHGLAISYESNGQFDKAIELLEHVVKIEATILAEENPSRLVSQRALERIKKSRQTIAAGEDK